VDEEGKTRIRQRYLISAPVKGQLRRVPFKAGAEVTAGETVLAVIDPLPSSLLDPRSLALAQANLDFAAANLDKASAAYAYAVSELNRIKRLSDEQTVSEQELEAAQWRATDAAKDRAASASALRQAEAQLAQYTMGNDGNTTNSRPPVEVKAAVSGSVLRVFEESSRVVVAGTPLLEIGDPTDLEAVIECLSRDGATMTPGMIVDLERWGGGEPLRGRVRYVEPAAFTKISALGVEEQRVNVVVDVLTPPDQRPGVGDSFRVEARIVVWEANQVLKVPAGALFRQGQQWAAFVVVNGRAQLRLVEAGHSSGAATQIVEGLAEGEKVILYPGERVREGMRVRSVRI
jgi:HlyD family secretion protein